MRVTKVWSGLISLNNYELVIGTDAASPSSHLLLTSSSQKELHRTPFKSNLHNSSGRDTAEEMEWNQRGGVTCPRSTSSSKTEPKFKFLTPQSIMVSLLPSRHAQNEALDPPTDLYTSPTFWPQMWEVRLCSLSS